MYVHVLVHYIKDKNGRHLEKSTSILLIGYRLYNNKYNKQSCLF